MKNNENLYLIGFLILLIQFNCLRSQNDSVQKILLANPKNETQYIEADKKLSIDTATLKIEVIGSFLFRRSYADLQFIKNEREADKYYEKQAKSLPILLYENYDKKLLERLRQLGYAKGLGLVEKKFRNDTLSSFTQISATKEKIKIEFKNVFKTNESGPVSALDVRVSNPFSKDSISVEGMESAWTYVLLDIIPGGFKEIVILNQWYIMNGDNFDLTILEITEKKK